MFPVATTPVSHHADDAGARCTRCRHSFPPVHVGTSPAGTFPVSPDSIVRVHPGGKSCETFTEVHETELFANPCSGLIDAGVWVVCGSCDLGVPADEVEHCPWHGYVCADCQANKSRCTRSCYF
jgi:hypothetical protein